MTSHDTLLIVFIAVTSLAVVIQMGILIALYAAVKKSTGRVEAIAEQVQTKALPTLELAQSTLQEYRPKIAGILAESSAMLQEYRPKIGAMLTETNAMLQDYRPKIDTILANASSTSTKVKDEVARVDVKAIGEIVERARIQVIRIDELLTRTIDRVEGVTEKVNQSVSVPVRQASGVVQGLSVALNMLFRKSRKPDENARKHKDEMFI